MTTAIANQDTIDSIEIAEMLKTLVAEAEERRRISETRCQSLLGDMSPLAAQSMESLSKAMLTAEERGYLEFGQRRGGDSRPGGHVLRP